MATIRREINVEASPEAAWDALRDFAAVHERVAAGFVTDCRGDGETRVVTFVTGAVAREQLVTADDDRHRLVYTVVESALNARHHQSSVEVLPVAGVAGMSTLVWTTDVLPEALAAPLEHMMELGAEAIAATLRQPQAEVA